MWNATKLPIVPKWNWNMMEDFSDKNKELATNRTKVELKRGCLLLHFWSGNSYQSYQSGIETYEWGEKGGSVFCLPIVPKWNWNMCHRDTVTAGQRSTNRTKVELKQPASKSVISCRYSTNRTKVELKLKIPGYGADEYIPYQSYQSGIETELRKRKYLMFSWLPIVPKWNWN